MLDTLEDIERQITAGEDSRSEFKEVVVRGRRVKSPDTESLAGEMVAFANADGGVIFLGVDDDGIVRGLQDEHLKEIEGWVINVATHNCNPAIRPVLRNVLLQGPDGTDTAVILVEVHRGLYVHATHSGRHYERVGSSKQILAGPRLARLFQERGRAFVFDEQPVPTATLEDLDQRALHRYLGGGIHSIPWSDLLLNTRIAATVEDDVVRPTVAGLLAFGKVPSNHLQSAYIEAAVYRGTRLTSDELVHTERIKGCANVQIEGAAEFVERFMLKPARKPAGRKDYPQYDSGVIHEAVVNAVAHRDYSIAGSKIRLFLFADRMDLYSPGGLPNTLTTDTMAYRVFTRNQLLVNFLSRMRSAKTGRAFLESRGEGVRMILNNSEAHAGRRPIYELYGDELVLTIWGRPSPHEADGSTTEDRVEPT